MVLALRMCNVTPAAMRGKAQLGASVKAMATLRMPRDSEAGLSGQKDVKAMATLRSLMDREAVLSEQKEVKAFLDKMLASGSFGIASMKRTVTTAWNERFGNPDTRPNGTDVTAMYDKRMMRCGSTKVSSRLRPKVMVELHSQGCDRCREYYNEFLDCDPKCYMASMRDCIILTDDCQTSCQRMLTEVRFVVVDAVRGAVLATGWDGRSRPRCLRAPRGLSG